MAYDIIGDIHGHADALDALLDGLGYEERGGAWRHPDRTAVFLGDFIDRGPEQSRVIDAVRRMLDAGSGLAVMGNHEFNAIGYATACEDGWLRARTPRNAHAHAAFLEAFGLDTPAYREAIAWMGTLPLWLETDGFRAVHACWHPGMQEALLPHLDAGRRLTGDGLRAVHRRGTVAWDAAETVLKGLEVDLPEGAGFADVNGIARSRTRVAWWRDPETYREAVFDSFVGPDVLERLSDEPLPSSLVLRYDGDKPVFFGHYWMQGEPRLVSDEGMRVCLDWSVAKDGYLCAYTWDGEPRPDPANLTWVRPGPRDTFRAAC